MPDTYWKCESKVGGVRCFRRAEMTWRGIYGNTQGVSEMKEGLQMAVRAWLRLESEGL